MTLNQKTENNLKQELGLLDVFCVATGAMISSGLFILPGLAYAKAGPAVIISYLLAGFLCIPTLLSSAELITAMPKAGGDYFYIMRGFGPLLGTIAGFSTWFSLSLKGAFALLGMGAYLSVFTDMSINMIAAYCGLLFVALNLLGVKKAGKFQVLLVISLLIILLIYIIWGVRFIDSEKLTPFFSKGLNSIIATASFVFISYGGLTKVAALAEETKNPGRNLPLGMILSIIVTSIFYTLVILVTVGVSESSALQRSLTPISDGAGIFGGSIFRIIIGAGAFLAFVSTANSGIMTASRYPLGMSRDKLLPSLFSRVSSKTHVPYVAIMFTGFFIIAAIIFLQLELLVKIASSLLLLLFIFANVTQILFRESGIISYRPKFRSPLYPYMQMFGIISGMFLMVEMGTFILFLTLIFIALGVLWFKVYAQKRASQDSALIYVLEKLITKDDDFESDDLLSELKEIVIERDRLREDEFHKLIETAEVLDIEAPTTMNTFFEEIATLLEKTLTLDKESIYKKFTQRENESSTVVKKGLAIPHIIVEGGHGIHALLVRAKDGIIFPDDEVIHTLFVLAGSSDKRTQHLQVLAAIAQITQNPEFEKQWLEASRKELKNIILMAERRIAKPVKKTAK